MGSAIIAELERAARPSATQYIHARLLRVGMLTREQCLNIYHLLSRVALLGVPGAAVELGCNEGGSSMLIQKTLDSLGFDVPLHVYDSFAGLPENAAADRMGDGTFYFSKRNALGASEDVLVRNFQDSGLRVPCIHKGWFSNTLPHELPERICFAHIDADLHESTLTALAAVYPRLSPRAVVVIDDYCDPRLFPLRNILPGVKLACDEFLADKPEKLESLHGGVECHGAFSKL